MSHPQIRPLPRAQLVSMTKRHLCRQRQEWEAGARAPSCPTDAGLSRDLTGGDDLKGTNFSKSFEIPHIYIFS